MKKIFKFIPLLLLFCFLLTGCGDGNSKDELVSELMYGVKPGMSMKDVARFIQNKNLEYSNVWDKAVLLDDNVSDYLGFYSTHMSSVYVYEDNKMDSYNTNISVDSKKDASDIRFIIESEFGTPTYIDDSPSDEEFSYVLMWIDDNYNVRMSVNCKNEPYYFELQIDFD